MINVMKRYPKISTAIVFALGYQIGKNGLVFNITINPKKAAK